jgi:hypothetical protein
MLFTSRTTILRRSKTHHTNRRLAEAAGALVLVLLLAGNVAARELPGDGDGCLSVGPCLDRSIQDLHLRLKLTTKAGYDALVRE